MRTDGSGRFFRLTISRDFPQLGLLSLGGKVLQRVEPTAAALEDAEAISFLDPTALDTRPYPEHEVNYDAHYLVQLRKDVDDVAGSAVIYFEAGEPFLSWADRQSVHGVLRFEFRAATSGAFTLIGSLDGDTGIDLFRGAFRSVIYDLTPPPLDLP